MTKNNHIISKLFITILLIGLTFVSACSVDNLSYGKGVSNAAITNISQEKTITVSGVNENLEISESVPVQVIVSGTNNIVTIREGTIVTKIIITGTNTKIILPKDSKPEIIRNGINTIIEYSS